jgi:hypothetical protein
MLGGGDPQFSDRFHVHATTSFGAESCTSLTVAKCQPWFYRRLAPKRGTIALLGYPREHMVPRETWPALAGTQPNPARILTLEPERSEPNRLSRKGLRPGLSDLRAQAACDFRYSASNGSPFFQTCKVMAAILRAKVSRASSGFIPFPRRFS